MMSPGRPTLGWRLITKEDSTWSRLEEEGPDRAVCRTGCSWD